MGGSSDGVEATDRVGSRVSMNRCIVVSCFAGWHGFDLAQGLDRDDLLECLVTLASPRYIEARYGISRQRIRRLPLSALLHRIELWLTKYANGAALDAYYSLFCWLYDRFTTLFLTNDTRMLVAWHPFATHALLVARKRGIISVLDVGSTHPIHQYRVLCHEHDALGLPKPSIPDRVLSHCWIFQQVDWIAVPSTVVRDSFLSQGVPAHRLMLNPYGIDPGLFTPLSEPSDQGPFTADHPLKVLVVAGLTPRKGSRLFLKICRHFEFDPRISFTLVGSLDPPYCSPSFKCPANLLLKPPMPHYELVSFYHQHHLCFLPSIEEGFARVLIEASGCGMTLMATPPTGLPDLLVHAPDAGYLLRDHQLSTAVDVFNNLIESRLPLCHADHQSLRFFTLASYQQRAIKLLTSRLPASA